VNGQVCGGSERARNELRMAGWLPRSLGCGLQKAQTFARDDNVRNGEPKSHSQEWLCHKGGSAVPVVSSARVRGVLAREVDLCATEIPQGLKPNDSLALDVGAETPTP
jgi:hypothetical protein